MLAGRVFRFCVPGWLARSMHCMSVKQINVRQAHELQQTENYTYVDVRSVPEYDKGHPAGAHNVPLLNLDAGMGRMVPNADFLRVMQANYPADTKLLIGCQVGGRSSQAAQILASAGYTDLSNVMGGFGGARDPSTGQVHAEGWFEAELPVETSATPEGSYEELKKKSEA